MFSCILIIAHHVAYMIIKIEKEKRKIDGLYRADRKMSIPKAFGYFGLWEEGA